MSIDLKTFDFSPKENPNLKNKYMQQIRQEYPEYDDIGDAELADAYREKHYSDIDKDEFFRLTDISKDPSLGVDITIPKVVSDDNTATRESEFVGFDKDNNPITLSPAEIDQRTTKENKELLFGDGSEYENPSAGVGNIAKAYGSRVNELGANAFEAVQRFEDETIGEESKHNTNFFGNIAKGLRENVEITDFKPTHTWEEVKKAVKSGGLFDIDTIQELGNYVAEQGATSLADMGMMLNPSSLTAYGTARTQEMATTRAKNDGREKPNAKDYAIGGLSAGLSIGFDKWGMNKMFKSPFAKTADDFLLTGSKVDLTKNALKEGGKSFLSEAGTEALQEGLIEHGGENWGTKNGNNVFIDWDRAFGAAVAGGVMGGTMGTTSSSAGQLINASNFDKSLINANNEHQVKSLYNNLKFNTKPNKNLSITIDEIVQQKLYKALNQEDKDKNLAIKTINENKALELNTLNNHDGVMYRLNELTANGQGDFKYYSVNNEGNVVEESDNPETKNQDRFKGTPEEQDQIEEIIRKAFNSNPEDTTKHLNQIKQIVQNSQTNQTNKALQETEKVEKEIDEGYQKLAQEINADNQTQEHSSATVAERSRGTLTNQNEPTATHETPSEEIPTQIKQEVNQIDQKTTQIDQEVNQIDETTLKQPSPQEIETEDTSTTLSNQSDEAKDLTLEDLQQHPRFQELMEMRKDVKAKDIQSSQKLVQKRQIRHENNGNGYENEVISKGLYEPNYDADFELTKQDVENIRKGTPSQEVIEKLQRDLGVLDNNPTYQYDEDLEAQEAQLHQAMDDFHKEYIQEEALKNAPNKTIKAEITQPDSTTTIEEIEGTAIDLPHDVKAIIAKIPNGYAVYEQTTGKYLNVLADTQAKAFDQATNLLNKIGKEKTHEAINKLPKLNEKKTQKTDVKKSFANNLKKGINDILSNKKEKIVIEKVSQKEQTQILKNFSDIRLKNPDNFTRVIDKSQIKHTLKNHGNIEIEEARGNIAVTIDDISNYMDIVSNADLKHYGYNHQNKPTVISGKQINGYYVVVEEVRTGKSDLAFFTMRKTKGELSEDALILAKDKPQALRPKSTSSASKSENTLSENGQDKNPDSNTAIKTIIPQNQKKSKPTPRLRSVSVAEPQLKTINQPINTKEKVITIKTTRLSKDNSLIVTKTKGKPFTSSSGEIFVIIKNPEPQYGKYSVIEPQTGMSLTYGKTQKEARENLNKQLKHLKDTNQDLQSKYINPFLSKYVNKKDPSKKKNSGVLYSKEAKTPKQDLIQEPKEVISKEEALSILTNDVLKDYAQELEPSADILDVKDKLKDIENIDVFLDKVKHSKLLNYLPYTLEKPLMIIKKDEKYKYFKPFYYIKEGGGKLKIYMAITTNRKDSTFMISAMPTKIGDIRREARNADEIYRGVGYTAIHHTPNHVQSTQGQPVLEGIIPKSKNYVNNITSQDIEALLSTRINKIEAENTNPQTEELLKQKYQNFKNKPIKRVIFKDGVKHAINRHSNDPLPVSKTDISKYIDIVHTYDMAKFGKTKNGNEAIIYGKQINDNEFTIVVETIHPKQNELRFHSTYKSNGILTQANLLSNKEKSNKTQKTKNQIHDEESDLLFSKGADDVRSNYLPSFLDKGFPLRPENGKIKIEEKEITLPTFDKPQTVETVREFLKDIIGNRLYDARVKGKTQKGFYNLVNTGIRVKAYHDIETISHEMAHYLDFYYKNPTKKDTTSYFKDFKNTHSDFIKFVSYTSNPELILDEGFAEFMRLYITRYNELLEINGAKEVVADFEALISKDNGSATLTNPSKKVTERSRSKSSSLQEKLHSLREEAHKYFYQGGDARNSASSDNSLSKDATKLKDKNKNTLSQWRQKAIDKNHSIKMIEEHLKGDQPIQANENAYKLFNLVNGAGGTVDMTLEYGRPYVKENGDIGLDESKGGLDAIFKPLFDKGRKRVIQWENYAKARRAKELSKQGRENRLDAGAIEEGLAHGETYPEFAEIFEKYQEFNDEMLDFYVDMKLITKEQKESFREYNKDYIPFHRVKETISHGKAAQNISSSSLGTRLKGGTRTINNIMDNIYGSIEKNIRDAYLARAKSALFEMLSKEDGAEYAMEIDKDHQKLKSSISSQAKAVAKVLSELGFGIDKTGLITKITQNGEQNISIGIKKIQEVLEKNPQLLETWSIGLQPKSTDKMIDSAIIDGKRVYFEINDPMLIDTLSHQKGVIVENKVLQYAMSYKNLSTFMITTNPLFYLNNVARDTVSASIMSENGFIPIHHSVKGMISYLYKDEHYKSFMVNGGAGSTRREALGKYDGIVTNTEKTKRHMSALYKFADYMAYASDLFELGTRIGEHQLAQKRGKSELESAYGGREVSTDFMRSGSDENIRKTLSTIAFAKAGINSIDRLYRRFRDTKTAEDKKRLFIAGASIATFSLMLMFWNRDDERYNKLTKDQKSMNWYIYWDNIIGKKATDTLLKPLGLDIWKIPKPHDIGILFANLIEMALDPIFSDATYEDSKERFFFDLFRSGAVMDYPSVLKGTIDVMRNKDFRDIPIESLGMKFKPKELRAKRTTPELYKLLGNKVLSPAQMHYLSNSILGLYGRMLDDAMEATLWDSDKKGGRAYARTGTYPLSRLLGKEVEGRTKWDERFYDYYKKASEASSEHKGYIKEGNKKALANFRKDKEKIKLLHLRKYINKRQAQLSRIRKTIQKILDGKLSYKTAKAKEKRINELLLQKHKITQKTVEYIKQRLKPKE